MQRAFVCTMLANLQVPGAESVADGISGR